MMRTAMLLIAALAAGCGSQSPESLADSLRREGVDVQVQRETPETSVLIEKGTGQRVVLTVATSRAEARQVYERVGREQRPVSTFPSGRYVFTSVTPADDPLLVKLRRAMP